MDKFNMRKSVSNVAGMKKAKRERGKYLTTAAYPAGVIAEALGLIYNNEFQYDGSGINDLVNYLEEKVTAINDEKINELMKATKSRMKLQ